jgi:hypothetical protein
LLQDTLGYLHFALDTFLLVTPVEGQVTNGTAYFRVLLNGANKRGDVLVVEVDELVGFGETDGVLMAAYQEKREKVSWALLGPETGPPRL